MQDPDSPLKAPEMNQEGSGEKVDRRHDSIAEADNEYSESEGTVCMSSLLSTSCEHCA